MPSPHRKASSQRETPVVRAGFAGPCGSVIQALGTVLAACAGRGHAGGPWKGPAREAKRRERYLTARQVMVLKTPSIFWILSTIS